ncbi:Glyoxylase, beta-lactamase superfamily II [Malonomonas rubra DSM 5091]|uniref:Glyoxylase, beta-lactamase superfamily II n=1 Tax=Malonomonas rubra DSM 5091 TaxID=1122189 RepID=A0A1M6FGQ2_MALRU|nr:hydroxyacylglutathione hydrolase family protein [Malonomonas rubra]SHI96865.1 Glyoxylase, beta-lactamase superfamily II [Malonomonas rubra DSM 5091]
MEELLIVQLDASEMDNFSYLVYCPKTMQGAAVDPSMRPEVLLAEAERLGVHLNLLLNTHGHQDHVAGNPKILAQGNIKLAASPIDVENPDIPLAEGAKIPLGAGEIDVLHTPGHTPGSVVFKIGRNIITGDTLFVSRCGRADLPGSKVDDLYTSLLRLKKLPPETKVYPGHDYGPTPTSTIGWELQNNDFLKCPDLDSFIKLRLG